MEQRIYAQKDAKLNETDRLELGKLLLKLGYTVRIGKERKDGKTTNQYYIAYSKQE